MRSERVLLSVVMVCVMAVFAGAADVTTELAVTFNGSIDGASYVAGDGEVINGTLDLMGTTATMEGGIFTIAASDSADGLRFLPNIDLGDGTGNTTDLIAEAVARRTSEVDFLEALISVQGSLGYRYHDGSASWHAFTTTPGPPWVSVAILSPEMSMDEMKHYALVYDYISDTGCTLSLYIDGEQIGDTISNERYSSTTEDWGIAFGNDAHASATTRSVGCEIESIAFSTFTGTFDPAKDFILLKSATGPFPENNETAAEIDTVLTWNVPEGFSSTVFFGTDPNMPNNPKVIDAEMVTTYDPGILEYDTAYYWQVNTHEPDGIGGITVHSGNVWMFATTPEVPVIVTDPASIVRGPANEKPDAVFTIEAANATGYQWYKDDELLAGEESMTLTITGVELSDEGQYSCDAINAAGSVSSAAAWLEYARLTSQFGFDDDLDDAIGGQNGVMSGGESYEVVYGEGIVGTGAIELGIDDDPNIVVVPVEAFPKAGTELTISLWLKNGPQSNKTAFGVYDDAGNRIASAHPTWSNSIVYFDAGNPAGYDRISSSVDYTGVEGIWNHYVFTKDAENGDMVIYRNGETLVSYAGGPGSLGNMFGATSFNIGNGFDGAEVYVGLIDDFRVYNYAVDAVEAAYLYTDVKIGETVCTGSVGVFDVTGTDGEPDCKVDLLDFAQFAADWLSCNQVPDCLPRP